MTEQFYYAVARGRTVGVYDTEDEANLQVREYLDALHERFLTRKKAEQFVRENRVSPTPSHEDDQTPNSPLVENQASSSSIEVSLENLHLEDHKDSQPIRDSNLHENGDVDTHEASDSTINFTFDPSRTEANEIPERNLEDPADPHEIVAFTHGSAPHNGGPNARAGYAAIFPQNEDWNVSEPLDGRRTNNRAHLTAALKALERANEKDPRQAKALRIFTPYKNLVTAMTGWVQGWIKSNWIGSKGTEIINRDLYERLLAARGSRKIEWCYVGQNDNEKPYNLERNKMALEAARQAAKAQT